MKLRKAISVVMVVAMLATIALTVSAASNPYTIDIPAGTDKFVYLHVVGDSVVAPNVAIQDENIAKIAKIKYTISGGDCKDENGEKCEKGQCMTYSFNSFGTGFEETKFCVSEKTVIEADIAAAGFPRKKTDGSGDVDDYLEIGAAAWDFDEAVSVKIEVLDASGALVASGKPVAQGEPTSTAAPGAGGGTKAPNTGIGGVMALGGIAILAAGAVALSRKRK